MAPWGGVAMLVVTGLAIIVGWGWVWAGLTRRTRVVAMERLFPYSPTPVIPQIQAIIWPVVPVVGCLWIAVGAYSAQTIIGHETLFERTIVIFLFALVALIAAWIMFGLSLPTWMYPGWRAERYYRTHPKVAEKELNARTARRFVGVRA